MRKSADQKLKDVETKIKSTHNQIKRHLNRVAKLTKGESSEKVLDRLQEEINQLGFLYEKWLPLSVTKKLEDLIRKVEEVKRSNL